MKTAPEIKAVKGLLIDPFQLELYPVMLRRDNAADVAELLDCDMIQAINLGVNALGTEHIVWVDDAGLLREPFVYPHFVIKSASGGQPMAGYGLVTGIDNHGSMTECRIPPEAVAQILMFEPWRKRIKLDDVIPQMMRVYKLV